MATTAKVWPFTYAFSALGVLVLLHPGGRTLRGVILGLGLGDLRRHGAALGRCPRQRLWRRRPGDEAVHERRRADIRIDMPMFFGILLVLYLNRSAWIRFAWWKPIAIAGAFHSSSDHLQTAPGDRRRCARRRRRCHPPHDAMARRRLHRPWPGLLRRRDGRPDPGADDRGAANHAGRITRGARSQHGDGLDLHQRRSHPVDLGVGGTTRLGDVTLGRLFNNPMFFLTDIGWLGVLFSTA